MSLGYNSAMPNSGASLEDLERALGIPRFGGATGENWTILLNGLIVQGGKITLPAAATTSFPFNDPLTLQVLGVFIQPAVTAVG
ncbi:hypothetical protein OE165_27405, partial [Escherichia coli]|uniref:hypothetical protein n=1 Tax=Escherichia coli TaxID=562 RepID=UPI0021F36C0F